MLLPGNLEDPAVPAEVVNSAAEQLGGLDALVMSHTESVDSGILDTTVESFDRHYGQHQSHLAADRRVREATAGDRRIGRRADQRPHRRKPSLRRHQGRPRLAGARIGP